MNHLMKTALTAVLSLIVYGSAMADDTFPNREIRFIVPWNAGGANDVTARALQDVLVSNGVTVVVENMPGGTGVVGMTHIANAAADGYTVGMGTSGSMAMIANNLTELRNTDYDAIALASTDPYLLVVPASSPHMTLADLLTYWKANPGKMTVGLAGLNTVPHMFVELAASAVESPIVPVPYTGGARVVVDLLANQLDVAALKPAEIKAQIDAGLARAIGVFEMERLEMMPDVQTFAENGYEIFPRGKVVQMSYVVAPDGLDPVVKAKLIELFSAAIQSEKFKAFASANSFIIRDVTGDDLQIEINAVQETMNAVLPTIFKAQ